MATGDEFPVLWDVFVRFPISHVLFVQILPTLGGGRVSRTNRRLYRHVSFWRVVHGAARSLDLGAFPRQFTRVHDGLCVGEKERRGPDVLSGPVPLHGAVPSLGFIGVLDGYGQPPYY